MMNNTMDELCINTIRTLAMDAVREANSGHLIRAAREQIAKARSKTNEHA